MVVLIKVRSYNLCVESPICRSCIKYWCLNTCTLNSETNYRTSPIFLYLWYALCDNYSGLDGLLPHVLWWGCKRFWYVAHYGYSFTSPRGVEMMCYNMWSLFIYNNNFLGEKQYPWWSSYIKWKGAAAAWLVE